MHHAPTISNERNLQHGTRYGPWENCAWRHAAHACYVPGYALPYSSLPCVCSVFPAQPEKSSPANPVVREVIQNAPSEASGPENSRGRLLISLHDVFLVFLMLVASCVGSSCGIVRWSLHAEDATVYLFSTPTVCRLGRSLGLASFYIVLRGSVQDLPALMGLACGSRGCCPSGCDGTETAAG